MYRGILFILLLSSCFFSLSQSQEFNLKVQKLETYIVNGQWDDLLIAAPDLLIEEPTNGSGYYYAAYALFQLGDLKNAETYLEKAEVYATVELQKKISDLKAIMSSDTMISEKLELIKKYKAENDLLSAAETWKEIWLLNKNKLEYGVNAVELFVELKEFPAALEILSDPVFKNDEGAQMLISRINETSQMKSLNGYNKAMGDGIKYFEQQYFSSAIAEFEKALQFKPGDQEASNYRIKALDEQAWQKATKEHSLDSYETYLKGNTAKAHSAEAHNILKNAFIKFGKDAAAENDITNMEYYFNRYLNEYPNDEERDEVKQIMCETYYKNGVVRGEIKRLYAQEEALTFYKKANNICAYDYDLYERIKKTNRRIVRYGRPDRFFYNFVYDPISPLGLSMGYINNRTIGMYGTVRGNMNIFAKTDYYTVDNLGQPYGNYFTSIATFEKLNGNAEGLIGLTKKIVFPFWIYLGGGISYNPVFWEMDEYWSDGSYKSTEWVKNTDQTSIGPVFEAGIFIDLNGFNLRAGGKIVDLTPVYTLGIGFSMIN